MHNPKLHNLPTVGVQIGLKTLRTGENKATILHRTLWEISLNTDSTEVQQPITQVRGRISLIPVRTPGRFGPISFRSGRFGLGRFGPILGVGRFGPILVGRFGPLYFILIFSYVIKVF